MHSLPSAAWFGGRERPRNGRRVWRPARVGTCFRLRVFIAFGGVAKQEWCATLKMVVREAVSDGLGFHLLPPGCLVFAKQGGFSPKPCRLSIRCRPQLADVTAPRGRLTVAESLQRPPAGGWTLLTRIAGFPSIKSRRTAISALLPARRNRSGGNGSRRLR